ncbi:hypothetical protein [Acidovorax sp. sic0104]|uniref:hypothetical protein n=1 Tax=Acidovorax sp. sic0104 TaxID=2854784 RepID=UPI001C488C26|nr:hypothetical protein [Acidovorax sp. sic0104]MBV7542217.1 hypothetical protein [Acidovorax sp. sic0104]
MLTTVQAAHVAAVFPETKADMARYLEGSAEVVIFHQTECGGDVPPIAIAVASDQSFWIDCCQTVDAAQARAAALGLRVVERRINAGEMPRTDEVIYNPSSSLGRPS